MKIEKKELQNILEIAKYGLATKEIIEGSLSFYFDDGRVTTFNDEVSVSCDVPNLDFRGGVYAEELIKLVQKVKTKELSLTVEDNTLVIKGGKVKAGLSLNTETTLPTDSIGEIDKWYGLRKEVLEGMYFTTHAASDNYNEIVLTCIHLSGNLVESSDGYRLAYQELDKKIPFKDDLLIPSNVIKYLKDLKPTKIAKNSSWVHFKNKEGVVLSCRLLKETYPGTNKLRIYKGQEIQLPDTIIDILDRASVFRKSDEGNDISATIIISNNKLIVKSASHTSWFEETAKIEYSGDEINFTVTIPLILEILKVTNVCRLESKTLSFKEANKGYLVMLHA